MTSFDGAVRSAFLTKCVMCKQTGASAQCAHKQCRKTFHLHCAKGCKLDPGSFDWLFGAVVCLFVCSVILHHRAAPRGGRLDAARSTNT